MNPEILKMVPLFSSLSSEQLRMLQPCLQQRIYPRGSLIVRAGEETDALYIILSGHAKVLIPDEQGREVILAFLGPHDFFGEMGLFDEQRRSASVETTEQCTVLRFSKSGFLACIAENFDLALVVIRNLVKRLRAADRKIESLALLDVYGRVARLLLEHAQEIDGILIVKSAPPKQEMARMIGASREMVSRVIKDLQDRGYIRTEKRKVFLLDKFSMLNRTPTKRPAVMPPAARKGAA